MAEITLKYAEGYEVRCPLCGTPESQSPVRYPDAQKPGERWITCSKCGMSYKSLVWQAAGGGVKGNARTVDAVEVVRCKDCYQSVVIGNVLHCTYWGKDTDENGYCHEGG